MPPEVEAQSTVVKTEGGRSGNGGANRRKAADEAVANAVERLTAQLAATA